MNKLSINKVSTHPLQTSYWGKFREEWGNEVLYTKYGLITLHRLPTGPLALLGRRPLTNHKVGMFIKGPKPTATILRDLKKIGTEHNLIFIKLEPNIAVEFPIYNSQFSNKSQYPNYKSKTSHKPPSVNYSKEKLIKILKNNGCVPGKTLFTPTTFQINLTKSEDEMMKSFSSKTRYNIRLAKRKGVSVVEDNSKKTFDKYIQLTRETVERQGFYAHSEKYHRLMWKHLNQAIGTRQKAIARLLTATYQGEIITTWILFVWKDTLYYPYGASSDKHKNVMANNLMMWEAIRLGKKLGLKKFDLWGREPGKGFTKFKEGYNPQVVEFLGTWDLVINKPFYQLYKAADMLRWTILRARTKLGATRPQF